MATKEVRAELVIGNAVGVTMGERRGEAILRAALRLDPDVVVINEADDIAMWSGGSVPPWASDYRIVHKAKDLHKDGTLVAVRRDHDIGEPEWNLCTPDHLGDTHFDINPRWSVTVPIRFYGVGRWVRATGVHFPPARSAALRPVAYQAMRDLDDDFFAGDLNVTLPTIRKHFPGKDCRGKQVLHVVANPSMGFGTACAVDLAMSDHPGVLVPFKVQKPTG
jgi:hypothetical protein